MTTRRLNLLKWSVVGAMSLLALPAHAGVAAPEVDLLFLTPFAGVELSHLDTAALSAPAAIVLQKYKMPAAFTVGGVGGVRLGPFGLGVLYQHTIGQTSGDVRSDVAMDKLYGQFALEIPWRTLVGMIHVDFGWAYLATLGGSWHGIGGKIGAALDWYPARAISLGIGADLDLQGYKLPSELIAGWGGTIVGRLGLHL